ncbi:MAG: ribbon-helix-helix domain-containing protein [gamma proteobacterium symbiont of Taylorina sp.]|nr:ribbon-helix-helix domain-containing protein [gamma proteobacterium symbiont of Taylorina sp.]
MSSSKIAITLESNLLEEVDKLVSKHLFPSRSRAIQVAIKEKLSRLNQTLLARECAKLSQGDEQSLAEEGYIEDLSKWPKY